MTLPLYDCFISVNNFTPQEYLNQLADTIVLHPSLPTFLPPYDLIASTPVHSVRPFYFEDGETGNIIRLHSIYRINSLYREEKELFFIKVQLYNIPNLYNYPHYCCDTARLFHLAVFFHAFNYLQTHLTILPKS